MIKIYNFLLPTLDTKISALMMLRGSIFSTWIQVWCSVPTLILVFTVYFNNDSHCMKLGGHMSNKVSGYKVSGSLRYLSKAVFTKALIAGKKVYFSADINWNIE